MNQKGVIKCTQKKEEQQRKSSSLKLYQKVKNKSIQRGLRWCKIFLGWIKKD